MDEHPNPSGPPSSHGSIIGPLSLPGAYQENYEHEVENIFIDTSKFFTILFKFLFL